MKRRFDARWAKPRFTKMSGEYTEFTKSIVQGGQLQGGRPAQAGIDGLNGPSAQRQSATITDGPFAETREQLGGYYLIEAKNLDEAIAIAARIPGARYGSIEVRPVWPIGLNCGRSR